MKRNTIRLTVAVMAMMVAFSACKKDEGITMPNSEEITQTAYADEGNTGKGFTFTAKGDWTATVKEVKSSEASWLKLLIDDKETYKGKAGTFTMVISLEANNTGVKRSATIEIVCGKEKITVSVTQEGTVQGGGTPDVSVIDLSSVIPAGAGIVTLIIYNPGGGTLAVANVAQTGGKITLPNPETLHSPMFKVTEAFGSSHNISDPNANVTTFGESAIFGLNSTGEEIAIFWLFANNWETNDWAGAYYYFDRDCNITGNANGKKATCSFKKGWNILYFRDSQPNTIFTTTKPEGINFNWWYESYNK